MQRRAIIRDSFLGIGWDLILHRHLGGRNSGPRHGVLAHPQKIKMRCRIFLLRILALEQLGLRILVSWVGEKTEDRGLDSYKTFLFQTAFEHFYLYVPFVKIMPSEDHHRSRSKRGVAAGYWVSGLVGWSKLSSTQSRRAQLTCGRSSPTS